MNCGAGNLHGIMMMQLTPAPARLPTAVSTFPSVGIYSLTPIFRARSIVEVRLSDKQKIIGAIPIGRIVNSCWEDLLDHYQV